MADAQQVQLLLNDLGKILGIADLGFREGRASLLIDDRLEIELSFIEGDDRLIVAAMLGELPADTPQERYLDLLDANFFWRGTEGATLGVERDSRTAVLIDAIALAGLHVGELEARLGRFVKTAQDWIARLAGPVPSGTGGGKEHDKGDFIVHA